MPGWFRRVVVQGYGKYVSASIKPTQMLWQESRNPCGHLETLPQVHTQLGSKDQPRGEGQSFGRLL